ncbi:mobile mystery protein A [Phenylobacterium sp.]|uniref:mobile mystery protein A n=1 Tax=Phenylobacterium sp. TaxID=1871053 RepID=UPI00273621B4|nr:mobile mystery protein A [Phenylobacterium sp.]MDP3635139.1 mobile mystery protein A [Phenylobacterium sp.]
MSSARRSSNPLARWAIDVQLKPMRDIKPPIRPDRGWIRAIREAIGMTTGQFASRLGVSQPRVAALERAEANEVVTLKSLRQAAEALDCDFVYAIVPRKPLEDVVKDRARYVAQLQLERTSHTMHLENQGVSKQRMERAREALADELLRSDRRLWADL